jgi:hypothetical protein
VATESFTMRVSERVLRQLQGFPDAVVQLFQGYMERAATRAKRKVSGPVLNVQTGRYRSQIQALPVQRQGDTLIGLLSAPAIPGRIHEFGGEIRPKRARFLRFQIEGQTIFTTRVTMPERPHLRPSLEEEAPAFVQRVEARAAALGEG